MTLRYALIGAGMMGQEHIRNVALLEGVEMAAIADPDEGMRAAALALAGPTCQAFADAREMLAATRPDAILIASPNHLHAPTLAEILPAYDVPILCEKPLAISPEDCRQVLTAAEGRQAPVWVAMEYRYMPPIARLIEEVRVGTAGRLHMLSIREHRFPFLPKVGDWNRFNAQTGGTMVEKCCHFFDLMRLILRAEPMRIYASAGQNVNHLEERYDGQTPDILDNAFVTVDFEGGARAMLDLCMFAEGSTWQEVVSATGDRARIDAMIPGPGRFAAPGQERTARIAISDRATRTERIEEVEVDPTVLAAGDHHGATFYQHQKFREIVARGGVPEVGLADGLASVVMGAAAEQSARTGRAIAMTDGWEVGCPRS
ncbi:MAG: Gfo/Idh/MocA family oxidoreductase [Pseudomonadota bacterium]